jgi:MFS family permease
LYLYWPITIQPIDILPNATLSPAIFFQNNDGPLLWSEPNQGLVLGSYFWGYLVTQVPGGRVAELYGGKWVFFVAVVLNVGATLLSPICSKAGFEYLMLMRDQCYKTFYSHNLQMLRG